MKTLIFYAICLVSSASAAIIQQDIYFSWLAGVFTMLVIRKLSEIIDVVATHIELL